MPDLPVWVSAVCEALSVTGAILIFAFTCYDLINLRPIRVRQQTTEEKIQINTAKIDHNKEEIDQNHEELLSKLEGNYTQMWARMNLIEANVSDGRLKDVQQFANRIEVREDMKALREDMNAGFKSIFDQQTKILDRLPKQ